MTEGTSQGLFVVVAIVIFGIFIGLSYTLFGSEGLSNNLNNLFEDSIEKVNIPIGEEIPIYDYLMLHNGKVTEWSNYYNADKGKITLTSKGEEYIGIRTIPELLTPNSKYMISYKIKKISGNVTKLGGHLSVSDDTEIWMDNKVIENLGQPTTERYTFGYSNDNEEHKVKMLFNTNNWNTEYVLSHVYLYRSFYLQPNHQDWEQDYVVEVSDIELIKLQ